MNLSDILSGAEKDFDKIKTAIEADWNKAVAAFPGLSVLASSELANVKQAASNALAFADTEIAPKLTDATTMVESAADTLIMQASALAGPIGTASTTISVPAANAAIGIGFGLLKAAITNAEAKWRAALPTPTTQTAAPAA